MSFLLEMSASDPMKLRIWEDGGDADSVAMAFSSKESLDSEFSLLLYSNHYILVSLSLRVCEDKEDMTTVGKQRIMKRLGCCYGYY